MRLRGVPRSKWGRIAAGLGVVTVLGVCAALLIQVQNAVMRDERFVIPASSAIVVEGNHHLTRAQLLSIFGEDVERNIFLVSLAERRSELEHLPWVEHATVMRLLPDHLRVAVVERTPVAFVRQAGQIGLVDKSGTLLDMASDGADGAHYSFPVVTGIAAQDPLSTRAARIRIFLRFTADLDAGGEKVSEELSEVDLSNPEDVVALIPENHAEVLVHFGDTDFLDRYQKYKQHLAEWLTQYPRLASVDMRYDRQVVLELQPGSPPVAVDGASALPAAGNAGKDAGGDRAIKKAAQERVAGPRKGYAARKSKAVVQAAHVNATVVHPAKASLEKKKVADHPVHPGTEKGPAAKLLPLNGQPYHAPNNQSFYPSGNQPSRLPVVNHP